MKFQIPVLALFFMLSICACRPTLDLNESREVTIPSDKWEKVRVTNGKESATLSVIGTDNTLQLGKKDITIFTPSVVYPLDTERRLTRKQLRERETLLRNHIKACLSSQLEVPATRFEPVDAVRHFITDSMAMEETRYSWIALERGQKLGFLGVPEEWLKDKGAYENYSIVVHAMAKSSYTRSNRLNLTVVDNRNERIAFMQETSWKKDPMDLDAWELALDFLLAHIQ